MELLVWTVVYQPSGVFHLQSDVLIIVFVRRPWCENMRIICPTLPADEFRLSVISFIPVWSFSLVWIFVVTAERVAALKDHQVVTVTNKHSLMVVLWVILPFWLEMNRSTTLIQKSGLVHWAHVTHIKAAAYVTEDYVMQWWAGRVVSWTLLTVTLYCFFHAQQFNYSGLHSCSRDREANPFTLHLRLHLLSVAVGADGESVSQLSLTGRLNVSQSRNLELTRWSLIPERVSPSLRIRKGFNETLEEMEEWPSVFRSQELQFQMKILWSEIIWNQYICWCTHIVLQWPSKCGCQTLVTHDRIRMFHSLKTNFTGNVVILYFPKHLFLFYNIFKK